MPSNSRIESLEAQARTIKRVVYLTLVLFSIGLPSCSSRQPFYDSMNAIDDNAQRGRIAVLTWENQSFNDALREFGPPSQEFEGPDDVYYYKWYLSRGELELSFQVKDGMIIYADSSGTNRAYAALINRKHPQVSIFELEEIFQEGVEDSGAPWRDYPSSK